MDPVRILGLIVGGSLIGLALVEPMVNRLSRRAVVVPVVSRFGPGARILLVCAGLLCGVGGHLFANWRRDHELPLTAGRVVVTAQPPGESMFPIELAVRNDFERMTDVQVRCMVERFATDAVDFLDADVASRAQIGTVEKGGSFRFECPAPRELNPPFHSADVRGAHVTVDVLFSVSDRWRRLGVRQGFELTVANGPSFWKSEAQVLRR